MTTHHHYHELTCWSECTCRVDSGSKSKDDGGNEFHDLKEGGGSGLDIYGCMQRMVEVFRSQVYIFETANVLG